MKRVLLIDMPFAELSYPSLALGLFKTKLQEDGFVCDVEYLNLLFAEMAGLQDYGVIGRMTALLAGEQMFAQALFGDSIPSDSQYYSDIVGKLAPESIYSLQQMKRQVMPFLKICMDQIPWHAYDIIGFTTLFEQNLPSLALAYRVKQRYPKKTIVMGGANCEAVMGLTMHRQFPFVDYICSGESDQTFPELVKRLQYGHPLHDLPGLVYRHKGESIYTGPPPMTRNLDALPIPNYDDYFKRLRQSPLMPALDPCVLMEASRGCWWGEKSHCTFCGLNGLSMQFRGKSAERCLGEMLHLMQKYQIQNFRFVDNILDTDYFKTVLPEIIRMNLNLRIFFEAKVNLRKDQIKLLAESGVEVQMGIESLSTHVLKLMGKGTTTLINVQTLKWCKQYQVIADWNLLFGFPGEQPEDYQQSLELSTILTHLDPPTGVGPLRMDRFSPNFNESEKRGFTNLKPLKNYKYIYPFDDHIMSDLVYFFEFTYIKEIDNGGYVTPLLEAVNRWKGRRDQLYSQLDNGRLVITDSRPVAVAPRMVFSGLQQHTYEYCDQVRSMRQIEVWVKETHEMDVSAERIEAILDDFIAKKLMIREGNRYLSLAVMTYTAGFELLGTAASEVPDAELVTVS